MKSKPDPIEACIREVDLARARVSKMNGMQVSSSDDRDYLKSVAYAWFRTHRPLLLRRDNVDAIEATDIPMRQVLDATAKRAAKTTYLRALKDAKESLASLRGLTLLSSSPVSANHEEPPDFTALSADPIMKAILERRWRECQRCIQADAPLAATVMMGGLLEALFVARANLMANKAPLFRAKGSPLDHKAKKPLPLTEWTLRPYIDVGEELGWITRSGKDVAAVLRDYRNYVHPEKERAHGITLNEHDSGMFWEVTKSLARQLLESAGAP